MATYMPTNKPVNYLDVPQELKDWYDIDGLYVTHAEYYRWFIGLKVGPEMLNFRPIVTREQADRFGLEAARRATLTPPAALLSSPQAKVYSKLGAFGMAMEAVWFYDLSIGRPRMSLSDVIGVKIPLQTIIDNYGSEEWMTQEFTLQLLEKFIREEPENLLLAHGLWFGQGSVGWMNHDEKIGLIEAMADAVSQESRDGLKEIWVEKGGDEGAFDSLWAYYNAEIKKAGLLYDSIPHVADVRLGRHAYAHILDSLRISHSIDEVYTWAAREYDRIEAEMNRLARLAGKTDWREYFDSLVVSSEATAADLMHMYQTTTDELQRIFVANKIFTIPDNYSWVFRLTPPENRQNVPMGMYVPAPPFASIRRGTFYITPSEGDLTAWREHMFNYLITTSHEVFGHGMCNGYEIRVPSMYGAIRQSMLLSQEGVAVTMEGMRFHCEGAPPTVRDMMVVLKSLAFRAARVIAELEWHIGDKSLEQITAEYAHRSGISIKMATRDIRRATTTTWEFMSYFLGVGGVEAFGKLMGGTIPAVNYLIENAAGLVPPHLAAWAEGLIDRPEDFDWLGKTEMVAISERFFPS